MHDAVVDKKLERLNAEASTGEDTDHCFPLVPYSS